MEIALINEEMFKENSPIKEDTIISKFVPYIVIAQKMYIKRIIGATLMKELQAQIKEASATPVPSPYPISPENQALLLEIAPALAFYAVYQGLPFHWASIQNKGITLRESENSNAVDVKDIAQLRRWIKDDADIWARDLEAYIASCGDFPNWTAGSSCGCGPSVDSEPNGTGFYIPTRKRRCNERY